MLNITGTAVSL